MAAALMLGASAVWVGTRFVASKESGASEHNKKTLVQAGFDQVIKTTIFTGRPVRHYATPYIKNWEENRQGEIKELLGKGIVPLQWELEKYDKEGKSTEEIEDQTTFMYVVPVAAPYCIRMLADQICSGLWDMWVVSLLS